ncbi:ankyrin repeat domain-containing protein, partial [bacterium]|nr:ankyrin repeat domain-containing protein [bacterium]
LIAAGASVKVTDQRGHTPLHLALWGAGLVPTDEHLKKLLLVVTYLLQAGANPNALNAAGFPAAYCAWRETLDYGLWEEIFAALFQAGADPLLPTNLGTLLSVIEERKAAFAEIFPDCTDAINHIAELARSAGSRRTTPQEREKRSLFGN